MQLSLLMNKTLPVDFVPRADFENARYDKK